MMDSDVRVFNVSMDTIPLDSSIIEDSETEVIELDTSYNTKVISCLDDEVQVYSTKSISYASTPDDIETIETRVNSRRDSQFVRSNDNNSQPVFKVMFRDESISRCVLSYVPALCLQCARGNLFPSGFTRMIYLTYRNVTAFIISIIIFLYMF